jgi:lipopolysaccharide export LptBFGC system permease protein LptF
MTIVERYLAFNFIQAVGVVLLLLLALFTFLGFAEALEDVGTGSFTTSDAVSVVLLTTPKRISTCCRSAPC